MPDEFFYIELAQLTDGKPFDALVPGTFIDMLGRKVIFKKNELNTYLKNTLAAIAATTTESGEVVGLPIDAHGHDKGDGAGWIVDAKLEDGKLRLTPKWTEVGLELIQKGIRRLFSPTVDTGEKIVLGGTLTNWPATRDKKGLVLLRPIELSSDGLMQIDLDEEKQDDGEISWVVRQLEKLTSTWEELIKNFASSDELEEEELDEEVISMELTKEELLELIRGGVREEMNQIADAEINSDANTDDEPETEEDRAKVSLLQLLEMEGLSDDYKKAIASSVSDLFEQSQAVAAEEAAQMIANMRRKSHVSDFARKVTGGTDENPRGINTNPDELTSFILAQSPDNAKYIQGLLTNIVEGKGVVEFEEFGHGKKMHGTTPIPEVIAKKLKSGELTVDQLDDPILGLGDLAEYDLSAFDKVKE